MLIYLAIICANIAIVSAFIAMHFAAKALQYRDDIQALIKSAGTLNPSGGTTVKIDAAAENVSAPTGSER